MDTQEFINTLRIKLLTSDEVHMFFLTGSREWGVNIDTTTDYGFVVSDTSILDFLKNVAEKHSIKYRTTKFGNGIHFDTLPQPVDVFYMEKEHCISWSLIDELMKTMPEHKRNKQTFDKIRRIVFEGF